jgi:hypothetical protein
MVRRFFRKPSPKPWHMPNGGEALATQIPHAKQRLRLRYRGKF